MALLQATRKHFYLVTFSFLKMCPNPKRMWSHTFLPFSSEAVTVAGAMADNKRKIILPYLQAEQGSNQNGVAQLNKANTKTRQAKNAKWGGEVGQKGIWVPRHDLTPVCILDWSIILKQWAMRQSSGSTHSLCKAIKCCHAQLLKGMGSVKCILLSTGLKIGSCEGREELQPGVRRAPQGTSANRRDTQQAAMPCRLLCGKLPGPCSAHWESTPCWVSEPCRKEAGAAVLTLPCPVTERLTQKRHRFKLKNHPNRDLQQKVSEKLRGVW